MTDRELLDLAAKAAQLKIKWDGFRNQYRLIIAMDFMGDEWNPLTDDGDALRLAAELKINIDFKDCCAWNRGLVMIQEFWGGEYDPCYRRAIVRAAAEIGRAMQ